MFPVTSVTSRPVAPIAHRGAAAVAEISSTDNVTEARGPPAGRRRPRERQLGRSELCYDDVDKLLTMLRTRDVRGTA